MTGDGAARRAADPLARASHWRRAPTVDERRRSMARFEELRARRTALFLALVVLVVVCVAVVVVTTTLH